MTLDAVEKTGLEQSTISVNEKLNTFKKSFDSSVKPESGNFFRPEVSALVSTDHAALNGVTRLDTIKKMYDSSETNTKKTSDLKRISEMKVNDYSNLKQHAGYSAEVVSTARENMDSENIKKGIRTIRADDLTETEAKSYNLDKTNDQYVDKIRVDAEGNIIERVQTKFVGKDASECYSKLKSKDFDKYFNDGKVDKMEIPKDYYDEIKTELIDKDLQKLNKQLDRLNAEGKTEEAAKVQKQIDRVNKIDEMVEQSTVTSEEAIYATEHPKLFAAKELVRESNAAGLEQAKGAAKLQFVVSTAENAKKVFDGEMTVGEAALDVAKDTGVAGGIGYVSGFLSTATGSSIPSTVISMGVSSYDDVIKYANDEIGFGELMYDLGEHAVTIAGGAFGTALAGPAGGIAGSYLAGVGYEFAVDAISSSIDSIVETGEEIIDSIGDTAEAAGNKVSEVFDSAVKTGSEVLDSATEKVEYVAEGVAEATVTIGEKIGDVAEVVVDKVDEAWDDVCEFAENAADAVGDVFESIGDSVSGFFSGWFD